MRFFNYRLADRLALGQKERRRLDQLFLKYDVY